MALFTTNDINMLNDKQKEKRDEWFLYMHASDIEAELDALAYGIHDSRDSIFKSLMKNIVGVNTTYADVMMIRSFDFSSAGGGHALHMLDNYEYASLSEHAYRAFPESYTQVSRVSLYRIWKSKGFLKRLAEKLELPENMYLLVDSRPINVEDQKFFGKTDIPEYNNTLRIVYRFQK